MTIATPDDGGIPARGVPAHGDAPVMLAPETYPRRLIEVDLPIAQVSEHARNGRSVHHGHISAPGEGCAFAVATFVPAAARPRARARAARSAGRERG